MVQSILSFDKDGKSGLVGFGNRPSQFWLGQPPKSRFLHSSSKWDDPNMFSNFSMIEMWWWSPYTLWTVLVVNICPSFFSKACVLKNIFKAKIDSLLWSPLESQPCLLFAALNSSRVISSASSIKSWRRHKMIKLSTSHNYFWSWSWNWAWYSQHPVLCSSRTKCNHLIRSPNKSELATYLNRLIGWTPKKHGLTTWCIKVASLK